MSTIAGDNPWAILLCKWNDDPSEPFTRLCCESLFSTPGTGFNNMIDFFRLYTHGNLDLSGSQVFGWIVLPETRSQYTGSGANNAGRQELINWCISAATAQGVDVTHFFGVVCCLNNPTDLFGDLGFPRVVCDVGSLNPAPLAQEMLHGYGMNHARLNGSTADYQDPYDVMSVFTTPFSANDPNFPACASFSLNKLIGPGLNSALMESMNWLDPDRVWTYTGGISSVNLRPHHRRDLPGFLVAKVGTFYVEFRMNEGWDAGIPSPRVLVHRFDPDMHSYLMPATDGADHLVVGSAFNGSAGAGAQNVVTVTAIDPVNRTATLSVTFLGWQSLGGGLTGGPVVATNADGRLEVFVWGTDNALWHIWQTVPNGGWSGWSSLGGGLTSNPTVGRNADGRLEVFVRGTDNSLYHIWQMPTGGWSAWNPLGGGLTGGPVVATNADGRLEVFVWGTDNALWHIWQTVPNGGWSGWSSLGGGLTSNPTVGRNADGRLEVFVRGTDNGLYHIWQMPTGGWSAWNPLGGGLIGDPAVASNADGRLEVFMRGTDNALWHRWQITPGGAWN
jgi:acylphosphatase